MTLHDRPRDYRQLSSLSVGITLLATLVLLIGQRWYSGREAMLSELAVQAALIGANASAALVFNDENSATEILATANRSPSVIEAALYRHDGHRLARYLKDGNHQARFDDAAPGPGRLKADGEITLASHVDIEGRIVGTIAMRATLAPLYKDMVRFLAGFVFIAAIAAFLAYLAGRGLRQRMLAAERELAHLALYDQITGLPNRRAFEKMADQTVNRHLRDNRTSALLYLDLDGFKKVNDMHGHHAGDCVLKAVGQRIGGILRSADILARLGGDEFAVLLVGTQLPDDAARVAQHLIEALGKPFKTSGHDVYVGVSIGIAMIPTDGASAEMLLHNADLAMYHAKQSGRGNCQFFSEQIGNAVRHHLDIEHDLRGAIGDRQFYLVYQPQVDANTGRLTGIEALLRWHHPSRENVSPADFIPIAEESGLIIDLGRHVFAMACAEILALRNAGLTVPPVAINISARQMSFPKFCEEILSVLSEHDLPPSAIEIELTESVAMDRPDEYGPILAEIKKSGIRIAIDDFGTGYSSLAYLKRLSVHKLKIDGSFVHDLPDDNESTAIVRSIVDMAHALGLKVIAEGVETVAQIDCLRMMGCDHFQGYYTGRPMKLDSLARFLAEPDKPATALTTAA